MRFRPAAAAVSCARRTDQTRRPLGRLTPTGPQADAPGAVARLKPPPTLPALARCIVTPTEIWGTDVYACKLLTCPRPAPFAIYSDRSALKIRLAQSSPTVGTATATPRLIVTMPPGTSVFSCTILRPR